jgi:aspartyl-tRNA(Asn)/glutamyl-tRNA(Gln) amidotransferase subunit A
MYKNYIPSYNATVYNNLIDAKAILVSKSNCDEFGMGGTGLESGFGHVKNFMDKNRIIGGSSSGSANHVAIGIVPFSIATDTGDSIRRPASFAGVCGYKPTYGAISRYGVFSYATSHDHVGIFAKTVTDCAIVADEIVKYDEKDYTSQKY